MSDRFKVWYNTVRVRVVTGGRERRVNEGPA